MEATVPEDKRPETPTDIMDGYSVARASCNSPTHMESTDEAGFISNHEKTKDNNEAGSDTNDESMMTPNPEDSPVPTNGTVIKQQEPNCTDEIRAPESVVNGDSEEKECSALCDEIRSGDTVVIKEGSSSAKELSEDDLAKESESNTSVSKVDFAQYAPGTNQSVPPHLRIHRRLPPPHIFTSQSCASTESDTDNAAANHLPRGPRIPNDASRWPNRRDFDHHELARTHAKLMKAQVDLEAECLRNKNIRKEIETDLQQKMDAALSSFLKTLVHRQAELLQQQSLLKEKDLEFQHRNHKVEQLEIFLAEGQKQLHYGLEQKGIRMMSTVEAEFAYRQAILDLNKRFAARENQLDVRQVRLKMREEELELRHEQYEAIFRDAIELELRETLEPEIEDRIAEVEYERGFHAGKEVGYAEKLEETRHDGFMSGYTTGLRTQKTLSDLRNGKIPLDSPELDFLFNLSHPNNLFSRGVEAGQMGKADKEKRKPDLTICETIIDRLSIPATIHEGHVVLANDNATHSSTNAPKLNGAAKPFIKTDELVTNTELTPPATPGHVQERAPPYGCTMFSNKESEDDSNKSGELPNGSLSIRKTDSEGQVKPEPEPENLIDLF